MSLQVRINIDSSETARKLAKFLVDHDMIKLTEVQQPIRQISSSYDTWIVPIQEDCLSDSYLIGAGATRAVVPTMSLTPTEDSVSIASWRSRPKQKH